MKKNILFLMVIMILAPGIVFGGLFDDDPPEIKSIDLSSFPDGIETGKKAKISLKISEDCWELGTVSVSIKWGDGNTDTQYGNCKSSGPGIQWLDKTDFEFEHIYYTPSSGNPYKIEIWVTDAGGLGGAKPGSDSYRTFDRRVTGQSISPPGGVGPLIIGPLKLDNPLKGCANITCIIDKIITFIFTVAVILLPILIISAGIMFLVAAGDPAKIKNAKKLILYALIGFGIIFLSRLFIKLLQQIFRVKTQT